ncbi:putative oxidoreductase [Mariniflexile fucanivorans]|uniref:Putative oxidoreductase n=1 Tax=Mariniflexile fucanivorans TaxID=264023 RepID=A0A4V2QDT1_9FLAO|nr:DoxX family protein [Mariniflexile fucanivorans]TCL65087.1 putative oxidoreductase [Mariniflexile fucanivorans]
MNKKFNNLGLLILRLGFAGMMLTHGIPKLNLLFQSPIKFADPIGFGEVPSLILALIGEVVAPIFIIIGFKTRLATIPVIITMCVAAFVVLAEKPFDVKEKAILFLIGFLAILLMNAGKYSIDGFKNKSV